MSSIAQTIPDSKTNFTLRWKSPTKKLRRTGASLLNGASGKIRTRDPRLRRPLLYPAELQTHMDGRDDRIRTCDILLPKQARYQTAPRPAFSALAVYQTIRRGRVFSFQVHESPYFAAQSRHRKASRPHIVRQSQNRNTRPVSSARVATAPHGLVRQPTHPHGSRSN